VEYLLRTGRGEDLISLDNTHQRSAVSWGAGNGFDIVTKLLIKGVRTVPMRFIQPFWRRSRVNSVDRYGRTPLSYAVWSGSTTVVELLVKASARVDLKDKIGGTPLSYAVCSGRQDLVELLLTTGFKVGSVDEISKALLLPAVEKGHQDVVAMLLKTSRVDPNTKNHIGMAALHFAALGGHVSIMWLLLESSADIEAKDTHGCRPLTLAIKNRHEACVEILLEKNSEVNYEFQWVCLQNPKLGYHLTLLITNFTSFSYYRMQVNLRFVSEVGFITVRK
ncbi:ankyrin repeat-containing domain protein, partial [Lasiosphaeria hispida]